MPTSHYDVVVLGANLEPLLCAALLAREGLRVLVLGQGAPEPGYTLDGVEVEPFGLVVTGMQSPIVQGTLEALALKQDVRQRMADRHEVFQLLLPEHRINVYPETDKWLAELTRELPSVERQAADITRTLGEVRAELDMVVGRGLIWPPETFAERQQFSLTTSAQRYDRQGHGWTSWKQLALRHPLRTGFEAVLPHVSGLLPAQHSDATRARLHGHVLGGVMELSGGWTWFREALFGRIRSWGGDVRPRDRAVFIRHRGRSAHIIRLARTDEEIGCSHIVHGTPIGELSQLLPERAPMTALFERVGEPRSRAYRCSVHLWIDQRGMPEALQPLALLCANSANPESAFLLRSRQADEGRILLTATKLIEEHLIDTGSSPLRFVRTEALEAIRTVIPFLDDYLIWIDSPHDGLPPQPCRDSPELVCSDPWTRGPYTMKAIYEYPTRRALGVCALPTRTPVRGVFLCNEQVAPGLGFEGAFLAATSVARIVSALYRKRHWVRRGPWGRRGV
ncbi:MAG: FAD-dependent oxidoreductase [Polyangiales bacterium]